MSKLQSKKVQRVGVIVALILVAGLVTAVASTGRDAASGTLPGQGLDLLACSQICGGGEGCASDGAQCQGVVGTVACATEGVYGKSGQRCKDTSATCGAGTCTGGNHQNCTNSGPACSLTQNMFCCNSTVSTCATYGDGSAEYPYSCTCTGTGKDVTVNSRTQCTANPN